VHTLQPLICTFTIYYTTFVSAWDPRVHDNLDVLGLVPGEPDDDSNESKHVAPS
jgi:hypothetical protein